MDALWLGLVFILGVAVVLGALVWLVIQLFHPGGLFVGRNPIYGKPAEPVSPPEADRPDGTDDSTDAADLDALNVAALRLAKRVQDLVAAHQPITGRNIAPELDAFARARDGFLIGRRS